MFSSRLSLRQLGFLFLVSSWCVFVPLATAIVEEFVHSIASKPLSNIFRPFNVERLFHSTIAQHVPIGYRRQFCAGLGERNSL